MKNIFQVKASDLKKVRVLCLGCGNILETDYEKLGKVFEKGRCLVCGHDFEIDGRETKNPLVELSEILQDLVAQENKKKVLVEFPIELES